MELVAVRSSNIAAIGYDASARELFVEFKNDTLYVYSGVPETVHRSLMAASSHGTYLAANVKGTYRYRQIR